MKTLIQPCKIKQLLLGLFVLIVTKSSFGQFEEQTGTSIPGVKNGVQVWGDFNNDGFLDLFLIGDTSTYSSFIKPISKIYKNKGDFTFTEQIDILPANITICAASWGDYDNDGWLDLIVTGALNSVSSLPASKVYKNNGNGTFSEQTDVSLKGVKSGSVEWVDFDNDGLLDIVICGIYGDYQIVVTYKNNGNGTFKELAPIEFKNGSFSYNLAKDDFNNDGFVDIIVAEYAELSNNSNVRIYENIGDGTFSKNSEIKELKATSVISVDYNNDGWMDFLTIAYPNQTSISTDSLKIYKNNGDNTFSQQRSVLLFTGWPYGSLITSGDYNNDGFIDIFACTQGMWSYIKVLNNNGGVSFSEQPGTSLSALNYSSLACVDFNNDGYLDVMITGAIRNGSSDVLVSKFYKNIGVYAINSSPTAPGNLEAVTSQNTATLKWDKSMDYQTPQNGLSYNVRVGTTPGSSDIVDPMTLVDGHRKKLAIGNACQTTNTLNLNLPSGTYYWSVQAIDNTFTGGAWANENMFTIQSAQASNVVADSISLYGIKFSWNNGDGNKRLVFIKKGNNIVEIPEDGTVYLANSAFGLGTQIDTSGWFCVYDGTGNSVQVTGLAGGTEYKTVVFESYGNVENLKYNINISSNNVILAKTKQLFEEQTSTSFKNSASHAIWFDYNNDSLLDILLTGNVTPYSFTNLYKNNGDGTFSEQTEVSLIGLNGQPACGDYNNDNYLDLSLLGYGGHGQGYKTAKYKNNGKGNFSLVSPLFVGNYSQYSVWGDYNNDGYLDLFLNGYSGSSKLEIFKNNGDGTFPEEPSICLTGVPCGSLAVGDYTNDGFLDFVLIGDTTQFFPNYHPLTEVYKNNGDGTFTKQFGISLPNLVGSVAWGDYDNDGWLDLLISADTSTIAPSSPPITKVYRNNGDGTFSEQTKISLPGVRGSVAWGDYNNDGWLDIVISGESNRQSTPTNSITKIYKNSSDGTFVEQTGMSLPGANGSVTWGDYDNDGYLDLLITELKTGFEYGITKIYKNNGAYVPYMKKKIPNAPFNLRQNIKQSDVYLKWDTDNDGDPLQRGLSYNIRIGRTSGGFDVVSPMSSTKSGKRWLPAIGNAGQKTNGYLINNLPDGTYYWSVQAIDNSWVGGEWATEKTFSIPYLGIQDLNEEVVFYPNPARDYITIIQEQKEPCLITFIDVQGKIVLSRQIKSAREDLPLYNLPKGIYVIKIQTNKNLKISKLEIY